jgi:hypothetical protein
MSSTPPKFFEFIEEMEVVRAIEVWFEAAVS